MKILVTGSSGHLGEALVRTLRPMGFQVLSIDLLPSGFTDQTGSITDPEFVKSCMKGIDIVFHAATLHKPHIVTHSKQQFIDANITGTHLLLEAAIEEGVKAFIFTSTTSTFGDAMRPGPDEPTAWVTEALTPIPKNIYGVTKTAAEDLCKIFHRNHQLPCIVLRTSRFFLEDDDDPTMRAHYESLNIKANEFLYRRVDLEDVVSAHLHAMEKAAKLGYEKYIISATAPFEQEDLAILRNQTPVVVAKKYPNYEEIYASKGWKMFEGLGRVYINEKARRELGWKPKYDFGHVLDCLDKGKEFFSPLALEIGVKKYHKQSFKDGPYPV